MSLANRCTVTLAQILGVAARRLTVAQHSLRPLHPLIAIPHAPAQH